jgi:hypothetical protein
MGDDEVERNDNVLPREFGTPYQWATWDSMPRSVIRVAALIFGFTFLLVLLLAIHPWTFGSSPSYYPDDQNYGQPAPYEPSTTSVSDTSADLASDTGSSAPASSSDGDPASQAGAVTAILDQTKSDRSSVVAAVQDASGCGNLGGDLSALQASQADRQKLAQSAAGLDVSALSGTADLPQQLSTLLTDSATADGDFADWVTDLEQSCTAGSTTQDQNYQAAASASQTAEGDKQTFLATWNPIATQYGQETLSPSDI